MKIFVRVHPGASKREVKKREDGSYEVWLFSPPEKGKANKELIEILAEYFGTKRSSLRIISGEKSRKKILEVKYESSRKAL